MEKVAANYSVLIAFAGAGGLPFLL